MRDHLMGYTGHLRALLGDDYPQRLTVRAVPAPPQDPLVARADLLADHEATGNLNPPAVPAKPFVKRAKRDKSESIVHWTMGRAAEGTTDTTGTLIVEHKGKVLSKSKVKISDEGVNEALRNKQAALGKLSIGYMKLSADDELKALLWKRNLERLVRPGDGVKIGDTVLLHTFGESSVPLNLLCEVEEYYPGSGFKLRVRNSSEWYWAQREQFVTVQTHEAAVRENQQRREAAREWYDDDEEDETPRKAPKKAAPAAKHKASQAVCGREIKLSTYKPGVTTKRERVKELGMRFIETFGKQEFIDLLEEFGAKKLPQIADNDLDDFWMELEKMFKREGYTVTMPPPGLFASPPSEDDDEDL